MARYVHQVGDQTFEIDIVPMISSDGPFAPFFVAHIRRPDGSDRGEDRRLSGPCEVYGPSEAWALQNARDRLTAECGCCGRSR